MSVFPQGQVITVTEGTDMAKVTEEQQKPKDRAMMSKEAVGR